MSARVDSIRQRIEAAFAPARLDIVDDSHSHAGHAGARESGGGHFYATIVSQAFAGKGLVQRHQMVYQALSNLMRTEIHALSIKAYTPLEFAKLVNQDQE